MSIKNEDAQKKIYPLMDLVEKIYDTDENSESFDANYKDLLRIDKALRGVSDYDISQGILEENKDKYIKTVRKVVGNPDIKRIIKKVGLKKTLTGEEHNKYTKFMLENLSDDSVKSKVDELDEIVKRISQIESKVKHILNVIPNYFDVESTDLMKIVLDKYEQGINKLHDEIEKQCKELDSIDDERYEQKMLRTFLQYGEKSLNMKINK